MNPKHLVAYVIGLYAFLPDPRARNERGPSQSTENAILLVGGGAIAGAVIAIIGAYVRPNLPR